MTGRTLDIANWVLAILTVVLWSSTYAVFALRDRKIRRRLELFVWRLNNRWRWRKRGPRPVPSRLLRPPAAASVLASAPRRPAVPVAAGRTATARAVAVAEPVRIAEWRADNLPLRYRLLGRVRRGANDN